MSNCSSCGAPTRWARMRTTGRMHLFDQAPSVKGDHLIERGAGRDWIATHLSLADRLAKQAADPNVRLYVSHFATCPDAASWRRKFP